MTALSRFRLWFTASLVFAAGSSLWAESPPLREVIDAAVSAAWEKEKIAPAGPASDAEFLRRVYLDLCGSVPNYDETVSFLKDTDAKKRAALIDRLLDDPRFAQHQADLWDLIFFTRNPPGYDTDKREHFQTWLKDQFAKNVPYDVWVREILKADGNTVEQGAPMYYVQYKNQPEDCNEAVTQTFLGVQLQCARCHDHPFESWTQLDFYGMAAFFARLEVVSVGKKDQLTMYAIGEKNSGDVLFTGPAKNQEPGKKGSPVKPKFLLGDALPEPETNGAKEAKFEANKMPPKPGFSRKDSLADWVTKADNPFFARAAANRVWAQFFGRGIVHPVDNLSDANPASIPDLLKQLSAQLVEHQFDLKWYIRELVNSKTYQLSSRGGTGEPQPMFYQHARSRPLSAEELAEAWRIGTGYTATQSSSGGSGKRSGRFAPLEGGYMLRYFGQPNNGVGDFQGGLHEHLYLNNGPVDSVVTSAKGGLFEAISDGATPVEQRVDRLFLSLLNREPTSDERQRFGEHLKIKDEKKGDARREAMWVLMTCSEFRFNH